MKTSAPITGAITTPASDEDSADEAGEEDPPGHRGRVARLIVPRPVTATMASAPSRRDDERDERRAEGAADRAGEDRVHQRLEDDEHAGARRRNHVDQKCHPRLLRKAVCAARRRA